MYRRFLVDGTLTHQPPSSPSPSELAEGASELPASPLNALFAVAPSFDPLEDDEELRALLPHISWAFTKSRNGRRGQFIRLNRWPSYAVSRSAKDWGWVLDSDWVVYRSCCPETVAKGPTWLADAND